MKKLLLLSASILFLNSCKKKEIYQEKGSIDIISTVYFNASKGLNNYKTYNISSLSFKNDTIVEIIPDLENQEQISKVNLIIDSTYYPINRLEITEPFKKLIKKIKPQKTYYNKIDGALFATSHIQNFHVKKKISDTMLFDIKYKRYDVDTYQSFTRFYMKESDTLLPYSIYENERKIGRFKGQILRMDSYNKAKDIFVTMQLIPSKNWNVLAQQLFESNDFYLKRK